VRKVFRELVGTGLRATLLPLGSANNIARTLGFEDDDPARLIRAWPGAPTRACDVASLRFAQDDKEARRFVEAVGGGVFANLLVDADTGDDPSGEEKIERGRRLLLAALADAREERWEIELDGDDHSGEVVALEVMNVREAGPNVPIAPDADPGDGVLDVAVLRKEHAGSLGGYVEELIAGHSPPPPTLDVRRARRIVILPPADAAFHLDDKILPLSSGKLVVEASESVEVLVPRPGGHR
jgi:diacylglycerol kinase family enzyme